MSKDEIEGKARAEVIEQMRFLHNNKGGLSGWLVSAIVAVVLIIILVIVLRFLIHLF